MPDTQSKSLPEATGELWELTKDYARQETIDPLRGVARYVIFGLAGAVVLGIGVVLLMLAALRALQTQTGSALDGNLSWLPYVIVLAAGALVGALALSRIRTR